MKNQELLKEIEDLKKRIAEQKEIIETLKRCLKPIGKIKDFNRIEVDGTSNYSYYGIDSPQSDTEPYGFSNEK